MTDERMGEEMTRGEGGDVTPASEKRRRGPVARLALTRRVVAALEPLDGAEIEADIENPALPTAATSTPPLRTDLLIRALDLRIRVALLPGAAPTELSSDEMLADGLRMLIRNPETAAIVVVVDDDHLTCRIIEPFDQPDAVLSAGASATNTATPRSGPVGSVVRAYLRQINPHWDPPPRMGQLSREMEAATLQAAREALSALQAKRKKTREWREARMSLAEDDAQWVSNQALEVVLEQRDTASLIELLKIRAEGKS